MPMSTTHMLIQLCALPCVSCMYHVCTHTHTLYTHASHEHAGIIHMYMHTLLVHIHHVCARALTHVTYKCAHPSQYTIPVHVPVYTCVHAIHTRHTSTAMHSHTRTLTHMWAALGLITCLFAQFLSLSELMFPSVSTTPPCPRPSRKTRHPTLC